MKRFIFGTFALLLGAFGAAAQSTKDTTAASWAGPYIGVNVGGIFDYHSINTDGSSLSSIGAPGWTGGLVGGYDLALKSVVVGVWAEGNLEQATTKINGVKINAQDSWAIGGRAGYLFTPGLLAYGKVGFTQEDFGTNLSGAKINPVSGITYGGGFEYAVTNNIFVHTEYRRDEFEGAHLIGAADDIAVNNRVSFGIVYKLSTVAPISILPESSGYKPLK